MRKDDQGVEEHVGNGVDQLAEAPRLRGISLSLGFDPFIVTHLPESPVATLPLHALTFPMMTLFADALDEHTTYDVVIASAQLARGLEYIGFATELIPVRTRWRGKDGRISDVGTWDDTSAQEGAGLKGHVVVWVDAMERCIDLGPCQHPRMRFTSEEFDAPAMPVVMNIPGGKRQFHDDGFQAQSYRDPFVYKWYFMPKLRSSFDSFLTKYRENIEYGGLALAHVGVDMLAALALTKDLVGLDSLSYRLADLLAARTKLPPLPTSPPGHNY